ncbi:hypothetical protein EGW08_001287, partial [Elysia chlorotica]
LHVVKCPHLRHGCLEGVHKQLGVGARRRTPGAHVEEDAQVSRHHVGHPVTITGHGSEPAPRTQLVVILRISTSRRPRDLHWILDTGHWSLDTVEGHAQRVAHHAHAPTGHVQREQVPVYAHPVHGVFVHDSVTLAGGLEKVTFLLVRSRRVQEGRHELVSLPRQ